MRRVVYFEIDVPYCSLTYGVLPCEAALGVTGDIKCFNTLATCQDQENYTRDNRVTMRFTMDGMSDSALVEAIPCMMGHDLSPGTVSLGEDLGTRTSLNVRMRDIRHTDAGPGLDRYWAERGYDPYERGTFWGRFRARQPYIKGSPCRLIQGELGQPLDEMETRHFIVESFQGPSRRGEFVISCRDILKMLDGDRAQAPVVSPGYLLADISAGATSASLSPSGVGDEFYPTSGLMAIGGKEIVSFTRSGNALTLVRGREGTTAQALNAQDRCQIVLKYTAQDAADILRDLMVNYAGVPDEYIPIDAWREETANNLQTVYTRTIPEPTSVRTLVAELIKSAALAVWWDDLGLLVQMRVLKALAGAPDLDQRAQLRDSLSYRDQPNRRISEIWTYFGVRNPLRPLTDPDNFLSVERRINPRAASFYQEDAIEKRFATWIPQLARQTAGRLNILTLSRFEDPPRLISGSVSRVGLENPVELGEGLNVLDRFLQDPTGAQVRVPAQVVSVHPRDDRIDFEAEEARWVILEEIDLTDRVITLDTNLTNVNLRTIHDQIYPPLRAGDTIQFIVTSGVVINSNSTGTPAVNVGSWPAGFTPKLSLYGTLQGRGGNGGRGGPGSGGSSPNQNGSGGGAGGTALYTREALNLELFSGCRIWGGGGGGGGGAGGPQNAGGGGGGGGAGTPPGSGGSGPGSGNDGAPGTATSGGNGGGSQYASGGGGGGPGAGGSAGQNRTGPSSPGAGGAAGRAIDGNSYITRTGSGDIRGPQVN